MSEYKRYYKDFVSCDFCGQLTRGRVYPEKAHAVFCGACNKVIVNVPVKSQPSNFIQVA